MATLEQRIALLTTRIKNKINDLTYLANLSVRWDQPVNYTDANIEQAIANLKLRDKISSRRNRIVNPGMRISQQNGTTAVSATSTGAYPVDQWFVSGTTASVFTGQQVAKMTPGGSPNRLQAKITTAVTAAPAAGDLFAIRQPLEGVNTATFGWGTAYADPVVLRMGINVPAGTWSIALFNSTYSYIAQVVVSAAQANTDLLVTINIPVPPAGTWPVDTSLSMSVAFILQAGSTYQGALGWQSGLKLDTTAQTNGLASTANTFEIFDVGLYEGTVAPIFELAAWKDDLSDCRRYYYSVSFADAFSIFGRIYNMRAAAGAISLSHLFPTEMRIAPTVTYVYDVNDGANTTTGLNTFISAKAFSCLSPSIASGAGFDMNGLTCISRF